MSGAPSARIASALGASARCSSAYCGSTSQSAAARSSDPTRSPRRAPPSGSRTQSRPASTASGTSTCSGTSRASSSYRAISNDVDGAAAFSQTVPPVVGTRSAVAHGRRCGCSTGPVRREPAIASCSSIQSVASSSQAGEAQRTVCSVTPRRPPCARGCTPTTGAPACRRRRRRRRGTCRAGRGRGACRPARRGARTARRRPARGGRRSSCTPRRSSLRAIAGPTLGIEVSALMTPCSRCAAVRSWRDRTDRPRRAATRRASRRASSRTGGRAGARRRPRAAPCRR